MVTRELLAAVLGVALGLGFLAFPQAVVRMYTAGWTGDRHGKYGETGAPETWQWVVRGVGVLLLVGGGYFAYTLV
ncbi:hypothetical protein ACOZ4N_03575 [Halorientalis pallida]|uniref:hypothetical protein n=1 Tax=Halorientalis pallida TaxID=2479928 RepID=UPI003C6F567B